MNVEDILLQGTRADQPSFLVVPVGALYFVTDENTLEQSIGTAWTPYGAAGISQLTGDVTAGPGTGSQAATIANNAITTGKILDAAITLAKMADLAQSTIIGRAAGAGTGVPTALTATQATAILDTFTNLLKGLVPASGGGTTNFLRADATWAAPAGGAAEVKFVRRALTELELESLNSTPIELVAQPGSTKVVMPVMFSFELLVTTGYSSTPTIDIVYNGSTTGLLIAAMTFSWNLSNTYWKNYPMSQNLFSYGTFDIRNKALMVRASANPSNPGTGVATAVANLLYCEVTTQ